MSAIRGLEELLTAAERPALERIESALRLAAGALRLAAGASDGLAVERHERLRPHVYRLRLVDRGGRSRSLILKRMRPEQGARERLLARRVLPRMGLSHLAPPLLAVGAEREGDRVWHVHLDLGDVAMDRAPIDSERLEAAIRAMAEVHRTFAASAELGPWRRRFGDLGFRYLEAAVTAGLGALAALDSAANGDSGRARVRRELADVLQDLGREIPERTRAIADCGGLDTLIHGDLHDRNILLPLSDGSYRPRIIDWDHAAVGYGVFDLATFLEALPAAWRAEAAERYRTAMGDAAWGSPSRSDWNRMCDTALRARLADEVVWDSIAVLDGETDYGFDKLAMWLESFERIEPLIPEGGA